MFSVTQFAGRYIIVNYVYDQDAYSNFATIRKEFWLYMLCVYWNLDV